jgi:hypothetical protein
MDRSLWPQTQLLFADRTNEDASIQRWRKKSRIFKDGGITMNETYAEHIKKCLQFSEATTEKVLGLDGIFATNIELKIFEKCLSPYYYFSENREKQDPKPSDAQIKYANSLKIKNPESYTKRDLSKKIKEVLVND